VKNLDAYANLGLGYYLFSGKVEYIGDHTGYTQEADDHSTFYWDFRLGARYAFTNTIGAFLELGANYFSFVTAGVSIKI
jgi:hypothetical protein